MPRKNPETIFKEFFVEQLKTLGKSWYFKSQEVAVRGIPDIILCFRGKFIAIELKVDSPLSALQEYNLQKIKENGEGRSYVATPSNWREILQEIKEIK